MKPETLDALLVDRELGELPPDVTELLDAYLELAPAARREANVMTQTVRTTREAIRRFPELAQGTEVQHPLNVVPMVSWLARAAALVAVAGLGAWLGYRAGAGSIPARDARSAENPEVTMLASRQAGTGPKDLWVRYEVAYDRHRGAFTVAKQP